MSAAWQRQTQIILLEKMMAEAITAPAAGAIDRSRYLQPSPYEADGGHVIGRDPRDMPIADLESLGYTSPIRALRARCIDCCGGQPGEVRKCVAVTCPSWSFRMGRNLFRGKGSRDTSAENEMHEPRGFQPAAGIAEGEGA